MRVRQLFLSELHRYGGDFTDIVADDRLEIVERHDAVSSKREYDRQGYGFRRWYALGDGKTARQPGHAFIGESHDQVSEPSVRLALIGGPE